MTYISHRSAITLDLTCCGNLSSHILELGRFEDLRKHLQVGLYCMTRRKLKICYSWFQESIKVSDFVYNSL